MFKNVPDWSFMPMNFPGRQSSMSRDKTEQPLERDGGGQIVCIICDALFAPSPREQPTSAIALESAFLSVCHFCFRCRRPACPQCWDHVHAICGACVKE